MFVPIQRRTTQKLYHAASLSHPIPIPTGSHLSAPPRTAPWYSFHLSTLAHDLGFAFTKKIFSYKFPTRRLTP